MQELYKDKLNTIDEILFTAIKAVFVEEIEKEQPTIEGDNQLLGEKYRAYMAAREIFNRAINNLNVYRINPKKTNNFHKER